MKEKGREVDKEVESGKKGRASENTFVWKGSI